MEYKDTIQSLFEIYVSALLSVAILFSFFLNDIRYTDLRQRVILSMGFLFFAIFLNTLAILYIYLKGTSNLSVNITLPIVPNILILSIISFIVSLGLLLCTFYKVYKINQLQAKKLPVQEKNFSPIRVKTKIETLDKALKEDLLFNNTILLRAVPDSHPWIFWEKLSRNLLEADDSMYLIYICINRPKNVIIDEFDWENLKKMIENKRVYFIDGFYNIAFSSNTKRFYKSFKFNPLDINSLIMNLQNIILKKIKLDKDKNKKAIIVVDSLSYIYKFSGYENALRFVFYLIALSSSNKILNLLYYRKNFLPVEEEVALENAVDSIIDFKGNRYGKEILILTKMRLNKILKREIEV